MKRQSKWIDVISLVAVSLVFIVINATIGYIMLFVSVAGGLCWMFLDAGPAQGNQAAPRNANPSHIAKPEQQRVAHDPLDMQRHSFFYQKDIGKVEYFYTDVGVYVPDLIRLCSSPEAVPLQSVVLWQDSSNPYDNRAVAVCQSNGPIGYLYRGKIQDIVNDWLDDGRRVFGYISYIDPARPDADKNGLKIDIVFY